VSSADAVAAVLWIGVTAYAVFGGADFGAGFWSLFAGAGERGRRARDLIDWAIGPVWEANHVWLIFIFVVLWTCFSEAYASITLTMFVPLTLAAFGMQLAHAGRKASTRRPWDGVGIVPPEEGGWDPIAPTATPFADNYPVPRMMTAEDIVQVVDAFRNAAYRARRAGFDVVEVHAAHGYLIHEFLSPLSNTRTDEYGGSFENRIRLCLEVVSAVRGVWPEDLPLFVRISSTDWFEGGWDIEQSVELARRLGAIGVDVVDCSSGGNVSQAKIPLAPGYQVPFAERIKRDAAIATGAVGLITDPAQADAVVRNGQADVVVLAREMLRDPYWPLRAARELGHEVAWPAQYLRAAPPHSLAR